MVQDTSMLDVKTDDVRVHGPVNGSPDRPVPTVRSAGTLSHDSVTRTRQPVSSPEITSGSVTEPIRDDTNCAPRPYSETLVHEGVQSALTEARHCTPPKSRHTIGSLSGREVARRRLRPHPHVEDGLLQPAPPAVKRSAAIVSAPPNAASGSAERSGAVPIAPAIHANGLRTCARRCRRSVCSIVHVVPSRY